MLTGDQCAALLAVIADHKMALQMTQETAVKRIEELEGQLLIAESLNQIGEKED